MFSSIVSTILLILANITNYKPISAITQIWNTLKGINGIISTTKVKHINCAISKEVVVMFACLHLIWAHYML